jgi:hypothetical protein
MSKLTVPLYVKRSMLERVLMEQRGLKESDAESSHADTVLATTVLFVNNASVNLVIRVDGPVSQNMYRPRSATREEYTGKASRVLLVQIVRFFIHLFLTPFTNY